MIRFEGTSKHFPGPEGSRTVAVDGLDLEVSQGECLCLIGPSGCGKSTLLRLMIGLIEPDEGSVRFEGEAFAAENALSLRRRMGYVIQDGGLFPHMTARENVGLMARHLRWDENRIATRLAVLVELTHFPEDGLERYPVQLSGGQRQRVALGRAIVRNPQAFLMDEPLSNLDALLRLQTRKELIELTGELKSTVIYVTHDQVEAMTMGHRLAVMNKGEVVQLDTPENIFSRPSSRFVAEFIGSPPMNFLQVEIVEKNKKKIFQQDSFELPVPDTMKALKETSVILGFRPNELELVSRGGISGTVSVVETLGSEKLVYLKLDDKSISLLVPTAEKINSGETVRFKIKPEFLHLFNIANETRISFDGSV